VAALRSREGWSDPDERVTALDRPSPGVARRSGDSDPGPLGRTWVPSGPHGVSTPAGLSRAGTCRAGLLRTAAPPALSLSYRGPSRHPRTVPPARRPTRRTMHPPLGSCGRTTHAGTADPRSAEPPGPAACRVRGLGTPIAASTTVPADALRRRSVHRLPPSRRSPRVDRTASRRPLPSWRCSRRFASPPRGACGRGRLQGLDPGANSCWPPDPEGPDASMPSRGCTLQSTLPLRPVRLLWVAGHPPSRVGWCDVRSHLRLGVLRRGRVGWPLSGLPALRGFSTLRPSRRRSGRRAGRAHGFASRLARVAGGANRSEPRR
jgi:hypothetical protein